jgi:hypothetical protein
VAPLEYKVVETSSVTDEVLEGILNEWTAKGWGLEGIHFAMREASKRPAMAFLTFTREGGPPDEA